MKILEWVNLIGKNKLGQMRNPEKGGMGKKKMNGTFKNIEKQA